MPPARKDELQLEEHRAFQERFWAAERVAWVGFGLIMIAALAGLTGSGGPLAAVTADLGGAELKMPRLARWEAADEIVVRFDPGGPAQRSVTLDADFAHRFQIEDIQPQPSAAETTAQGHRLIFDVPSGGPAEVVLHVRAFSPGPASFGVRADGGAPRRTTVFVLP